MGLKIPNMFGKGYKTIPHELPSGQTAMFKPGAEMAGGKMPGVIGRGLGGRVSTPPPFKSKGYGKGDPRAKVMGAARNAELAEKRKAKKQRMPKPGQAIPYTPPKRYGPNTKSEQYVDDLFGV